MKQILAAPLLNQYVLACHGELAALPISSHEFYDLAEPGRTLRDVPQVHAAALSLWESLSGNDEPNLVIRRPQLKFARASWEITELCNYDCEHCYLGEKIDRSLPWSDRERLIGFLADSGILSIQLTGGEVLADRLFRETYSAVWDQGILISLSTNGSRLSNPAILETLRARVPQRITISVYGASAKTYDALTKRPGAFQKFTRGLAAIKESGLRVRLNIIVTSHNQAEREDMVRLANDFGFENFVYDEMTPTIYGDDNPIQFQATDKVLKQRVFSGCSAGKTFYHVDQTGHAMICKVGRKPYLDLIGGGVTVLEGLTGISGQLLDENGMPDAHKGHICAPQSRLRVGFRDYASGKLALKLV